MRAIPRRLIAIAAISLLGCAGAAAENQSRNDYAIVAESQNKREFVVTQGETVRRIASIRQLTLFGTSGNEAGIISHRDGVAQDALSIIDLHDLSHESKIPLVGFHTVPLMTGPYQSLVILKEAVFFAGSGNERVGGNQLMRLDRETGKVTAFAIPHLKPNSWSANILKAGNHIAFPAGKSLEVFSIKTNAFIASVPYEEQSGVFGFFSGFVYVDGAGIFQYGRGGIDKLSSADFKTPEKPQHIDARGNIYYAVPVQLPGGSAIVCLGDAVDKAGRNISGKEFLTAFNVADGKLLHQVEIPESSGPPVVGVDGRTLYLCDLEKKAIRKISAATGETIGEDLLPEELRKASSFTLIGVAQGH